MTSQTTEQCSREAFDYWRDNSPLRVAICILMREWGSLNPEYAESDDEAINAYREDKYGRDELEEFETIAREILQARQPEIDALRAEINEQCRIIGAGGERELALRAENARLQNLLDIREVAYDMQNRDGKEIEALKAENARLRESTEALVEALEYMYGCNDIDSRLHASRALATYSAAKGE